uniref:Uncharacterized protein n=1 Tax=Catagonus wagneri TaxID=51154 RepID=A0A8C3YUA6_9CETA
HFETSAKPVTSKVMPVVSANMTSTTLRSTPQITSVSPHTSQMSTSIRTTTHNSLATSVSSSVTITATTNFKENKGSQFDSGSFAGGIVLTLGNPLNRPSSLYRGCQQFCPKHAVCFWKPLIHRPPQSKPRSPSENLTIAV